MTSACSHAVYLFPISVNYADYCYFYSSFAQHRPVFYLPPRGTPVAKRCPICVRRLQFSIMDQKAEDIYEFKSSKDGAPNSPSEQDSKKDSENISTNAPLPSSPKRDESEKVHEATKRGASELDLNEDEENKRKRRKEDKTGEVKGLGRSMGRTGPADKPVKAAAAKGPASTAKASGGAAAALPSGDTRKSPPTSAGNSPKASSKGDSESDSDEGKRDPGPKVPPLKIVIPQHSTGEQEQGGTRNGKNGNGRHQALPYVVTSSSNDSEGAISDKVEISTCATATGIKDEKKDAATLQVCKCF